MNAKKLILTVDDHFIVAMLVKQMLGEDAYQYLAASNGDHALSILQEEDHINLILCDFNMPGMDGLEFCQHKLNLPRAKNIPVIMVTASRTAKEKKEAAAAGGPKFWLDKPFKKESLLAAVALALNAP